MSEPFVGRYTTLAASDPAVAPLAVIAAAAVEAAADPAWESGVSVLAAEPGRACVPLLHERTLRVDPQRVRDLLANLAAAAADADTAGAATLARIARAVNWKQTELHLPARAHLGPRVPPRTALTRRSQLASLVVDGARLNPLELLEASVTQDLQALGEMACRIGVQPGALTTVAQLVSMPLLYACCRTAAPVLEGLDWAAGYCPVCAAWPILAERRGQAGDLWLRCGRCGAGWAYPPQRCVFCGNDDHRCLGYLAPEDSRQARQAVTCDRCGGYLKVAATLTALAGPEIGLLDLTTLELDVAAVERGYSRPEKPGYPLQVRVEQD